MAQLVDFLIDGSVLFNIGVGMGNVGFRLVIIIVTDEIFHRILREEFFEFAAELGRQGLVMGNDQGGPLHLGDDIGNGKGLAGAGNAKQGLMAQIFI